MRLLTILVLTLLTTGVPAHAKPAVQCGDKIITNTTLTADLVCDTDVGLAIAASNVTLNLNGHKVSALNAITVDKVRNVTVRDGELRNITATGTRNLRLAKVTMGSRWAVHTIKESTATISNSTVRGFNFFCEGSVCEFNESDTQVGEYFNCAGNAQSALKFHGGKLETNWMSCATLAFTKTDIKGLRLGAEILRIVDSTITKGFEVYAGQVHIARNAIIAGNFGLTFSKLGSGMITGNRFENIQTAGLFVNIDIPLTGPTKVTNNTFTKNGRPNPGTVDKGGNLVGDGMHLYLAQHSPLTVHNNRTKDNARYGIWAQPGTVLDGGGNTSTNDPLGCLGVVCA